MRHCVRRLFEIVVLSLIITLFTNITPLSVSAVNYSSICPEVSLAPVDEVYPMLPKYDAPNVLNEYRECIHNVTKKSAKENIEPSITVLTHGLGGNPSHWSNDNVTQAISYDTESIIEKIRGLDVGNTEVYVIQHEKDVIPANSFKIVKLNIDSVTGSYSPHAVNFSSTNLSKKVVVIYKASDEKQHNITDYLELDYIIDFFSYKYYLDYHYIPKVNLIGHSRGGLSNIQYVNEHPYNIDSVFSIDTPYFGSEFGQMTALMNLIELSDTINSCGGQDILDTGIDTIVFIQ